jgi:hypothetical protein
MDGYSVSELDIEKKYNSMQSLLNKQIHLNKDISDILSEIEQLPKIPNDLNFWIESIAKQDDGYDRFKLTDFSKMFKINKKYKELIEEREHINRNIKIAVIDNLLDVIRNIVKE